MPELPEVETTCRGIRPHLLGRRITAVEVRESRLRRPVPGALETLAGRTILSVERRAKYVLIACDGGTIIIHLGMSGSLRIGAVEFPMRKHDHVIFTFDSGQQMRFHDPRRFGLVDFTADAVETHPLFAQLGPEPFEEAFSTDHLVKACHGRGTAIKSVLMNNHVVVGVGNIYANEALYIARIHPARAAGRISRVRLERLVDAIRQRLREAIESGGTTLRDFVREDGEPGYFKQQLLVYEREGQACRRCDAVVRRMTLGGRSTYFCPACQR